ncbi:hypothetical protein Ldro_2603 [Legionella drozanskii LLAP-1]|uniref:Uncharacterized protein n=1 Tax=Legionella drozanskii LLAP-1 TaxID=1212489 RepID=A0A0W0SPU8_9GAMM|nr:hypothetical protein Ldro_2603 [Legionella drozanskii LLAP-1]
MFMKFIYSLDKNLKVAEAYLVENIYFDEVSNRIIKTNLNSLQLWLVMLKKHFIHFEYLQPISESFWLIQWELYW